MDKIGQKDVFTSKMFFRLWWPGTLAAFPYGINDAVDAIVLGNHMGTVGLAAISFCVPICMLYDIIMLSFGLGGSNRFSLLMSEGKIATAKKCFNDVLRAGVIIGLAVTTIGIIFRDPLLSTLGATAGNAELYQAVKSYLTYLLCGAPLFLAHYIIEFFLINDNRQGIANIGSVISSVSNIPMTIFFAVILDMGAAGAALSTVLAQGIGILCYIPAFRSEDSHLHFTKGPIAWQQVTKDFKSGFSVNISYLYQIIFLLIINNSLIRTLGEEGVAIFEITQNVFYLYMYLWEGNAKAVQPLVSTYLGERYLAGINLVKKIGLRYSGSVAFLLAVAIMLSPATVCYIFGYNDSENMLEAYIALHLFAVSALIASFYMCYINFCQAVGDERRAVMMNTFRGGIALIGSVLFFSFIWQENIWLFYPVSELLAVGLYLLWAARDQKQENVFDASKVFVRTIENKMENMVAIGDEMEAFGKKWNFSTDQIYFLRMGIEELGVIMLKYGFKDQAKGYIHITVVAEDDGSATFHMRDTAGKFNPFAKETKKMSEDEECDLDLIGILVLKNKAESFSYRNYQGFNTMTLKFA